MGNGKDTNSIVCRESYFYKASMFSNGNRLCPVRSALCGQVGDDWLTRYDELVIVRAPVIIEDPMKVDEFARLSVLCPN